MSTADSGLRLDRITQLSQAGHLVGCRFYALQHPTTQCDAACLQAERLPPGNVAGIEIRTTTYSSPLDAHNAFVRTAEAGTADQQVTIEPGNTGVCYRTTLWTQDGGQDWACAFSRASTAIVVRTVVTNPTYDVVQIATALAAHF